LVNIFWINWLNIISLLLEFGSIHDLEITAELKNVDKYKSVGLTARSERNTGGRERAFAKLLALSEFVKRLLTPTDAVKLADFLFTETA